MDIESALLSKVITTGQLEEVIARGIQREHFADEVCGDLYDWLTQHVRRFKLPPSLPAVRDHIEETKALRGFEILTPDDALGYLIERFVKTVKRRLANDMLLELAQACDDPQRSNNIDLEFLEVSRKLMTVIPSEEVQRFSEMEGRIDQYERDAVVGETPGIPFGFSSLDDWTGGIQPHELVTISAFSGVGKSTLSMVIAHNAYVQGYTPLIVSLEMEAKTMLRRFDAMAANLDYRKMKQLKLSPEQIDNWRDTAKRIRESQADIPILDKIRHCTPDKVYAETVRHAPDLVVIDYITLMHSSRPSSRGSSQWQAITEITQDLKQNARTLGVPIIAMAQTNRSGSKDGAELDNIGYSISIIQDSDIVIGLFADDDMKERKEMQIRLKKNRDGRIGEFDAIWDHENQVFREKKMTDMFGGGKSITEAASILRKGRSES